MKRSMHAVAWVLLVVAAVLLWPRSLGGSMTYVITSGTSMQPMFRAGDLAVLRSADDYRVGDVVAYRSEELERVVMHRVLTERDGTYTFQGDNNDFVDPDQVREEQMLGRLVLRVPRVGPLVEWLLTPVNMLLVGGVLYLLLSDRRRDEAAPLVLGVGALTPPQDGPVVDVVDQDELERLAARYGRPVLHSEVSGERWVLGPDAAYRHRSSPPPVPVVPAVVPRPRRATKPVAGTDLGDLLRVG